MATVKVTRPKLSLMEKLYFPSIVKGMFVTFKHAIKSLRGKSIGGDSLNSSGLGVTMQYPEQKWDDHLPEHYRGVPALVTDEQERERLGKCVDILLGA